MIRYDFRVPIYDFDCTIVQLKEKENPKKILRLLNDFNIGQEIKNEIITNMHNEYIDSALTLTNRNERLLLVILYPISSMERFINIAAHEKRHMEDKITEVVELENGEGTAYLAGYLASAFYEFTKINKLWTILK